MHLEITRRDVGDKDLTREPPVLVYECHRFTVCDFLGGRVGGAHKHCVSWRAGQRVDLGINQRIELFPAARAHLEPAVRLPPGARRKSYGAKMRLAVWCRKLPIGAQMR